VVLPGTFPCCPGTPVLPGAHPSVALTQYTLLQAGDAREPMQHVAGPHCSGGVHSDLARPDILAGRLDPEWDPFWGGCDKSWAVCGADAATW